MASSQKTVNRSLIVLLIVAIGALAAASYYIFFAPRPNNAEVSREENTPNFSEVKSVTLELINAAKTGTDYSLKTNDGGSESAGESLKIPSGTLTPLQKYTLEKLKDGVKQADISFTLYEADDGVKDKSLLSIFEERDDAARMESLEYRNETLKYERIGTPPTATIAMSDGQKAVLATLKRAVAVEKEGQETTTYEMRSGVKIGKQVLLVHYQVDAESKLNDADLQQVLDQFRLKVS